MMGRSVEYRNFGSLPPKSDISSGVSERELAQARGQARAEGFSAGLEEAEARFDHERSTLLATLAEQIECERADRAKLQADLARQAHEILIAFLRTLSPTLARLRLAEDVAGVLHDILQESPQVYLLVEAAPKAAAVLQAEIASQDEFDAASVSFSPVETLSPEIARIHWRGGFDEVDASAATNRAIEVLSARLAGQAIGAVELSEACDPANELAIDNQEAKL